MNPTLLAFRDTERGPLPQPVRDPTASDGEPLELAWAACPGRGVPFPRLFEFLGRLWNHYLGAYIQPHYAAPLTGALLALLVQCLRHLRIWRPGGWPLGRAAVLVLVLLSVGVMAGRWVWRS